MQVVALVVSLAIALVGVVLFVRAIRGILAVIRTGGPAARTDQPLARSVTLAKESLLHTRMLQWTWVGIAHWFVFVGFGLLFFTLVTAFGQLFDPHFTLPLIGQFFLYEWAAELFTAVMLVAIIGFIAYRASRPKERVRGARGRFWGSTMWQGYFVEGVILGVGLCIVVLRGLEYALLQNEGSSEATWLHFPLSYPLGLAFDGLSTGAVENLIWLVATIKIVISFTWMIVISLNLTMGVAWHRFTVFFNIWFKRESSGRTALGAVKPLTVAGRAVTLEDVEELSESLSEGEELPLGVGAIEQFSWKGILDFTSCTECGRCQSQCPAWNTEKPLSPKLLITALRDHAYARSEGAEADRPLVADTGDSWFYNPEDGSAVIDPDVLWSCTSCGACVQQCPVDIEHVDHIVDMRRYQVLVESNFPTELNQLFKGLESKGNPWNMAPSARMDWAKDLPFEVKVVGETIESLDEVDWLFWVGCAGAYEDRAKKTTRAVAELLDLAGVSFGVLGRGETCTGDPARRAGNEFVFQGLATQNAETLRSANAKKVVSTCAHCFNTLKNEYAQFGVELEVVHHTQLLNRLVREGRLTPVGPSVSTPKRSITYHDPCFLGRHNQVYSPPRELLQVVPNATFTEMPRNSEKSFCCGAGGARMWMEERIGERINNNRTAEAVATGADQIAVGCPFCRVMLSDGLTAAQASGTAREEVEVLDVAQLLLASVRPAAVVETAPSVVEGAVARPVVEQDARPAVEEGPLSARLEATPDPAALKAEPQPGDVTQTPETITATEDVGPLAKASGGTSSLFDLPAPAQPTAPSAPPSGAVPTGGSLFDLPAPSASGTPAAPPPVVEESPQAAAPVVEEGPQARPETTPVPVAPLGKIPTGGSLFDLPNPTEPPASTPAVVEEGPHDRLETAPVTPVGKIPPGESLFDLPTATPPAPSSAQPSETAKPRTEPAAVPVGKIPPGRSLFDVGATSDGSEATPPTAEPRPTGVLPVPVGRIPTGQSLFELGTTEEVTTTNGADPVDGAESPEGDAVAVPARDGDARVMRIPPGTSLFDV